MSLMTLLIFNCTYKKLVKSLPEEDRAFLRITNYIINKDERKMYVAIPAEKRAEFRTKFWEKRDPDPSTEINEYKEEYFERIDFANLNFRETKEGWLTDRGRVYILLGPPTYTTYRVGRIASAADTNTRQYYYHSHYIWYYGNFPIIFVDYNHTNSFEMEGLNNRHLASINMAMKDWQPDVETEMLYYDFKARLKQKNSQKQLLIIIPYKRILFSSDKKTDLFIADFSIEVEITDLTGVIVKKLNKNCKIELKESESNKTGSDFKQYFKLDLKPGEYNAVIKILNNQDDYKISKNIKFKF